MKKKAWYIHIIEILLFNLKKNLQYARIWIKLEDVMLNEIKLATEGHILHDSTCMSYLK